MAPCLATSVHSSFPKALSRRPPHTDFQGRSVRLIYANLPCPTAITAKMTPTEGKPVESARFSTVHWRRLFPQLLVVVTAALAAAGLTDLVECSPPPDPIQCFGGDTGTHNCTITNSYGAFSDRSTCRVRGVAYPSSEEELVAVVAEASRTGHKVKVATRQSHSIPKLACPGNGTGSGLLISTRNLNRVVAVNTTAMTMTVESGMLLRDLIAKAAEAGLALPNSPLWWGLTIGGMLSTGAHGSSLWGVGGAIHEHVVGVRIVTPATAKEGYAKLRVLESTSPELLDAVKVSLGVLGVISQVTLKLDPMFKRSITHKFKNDSDLADRIVRFGKKHEFAAISWYPGHGRVVYWVDNRVPLDTPGNGSLNFIGFLPFPVAQITAIRRAEEVEEAAGFMEAKCISASRIISLLDSTAFGLSNDGLHFTGYPVVGYQNRLQASGACMDGPVDGLQTACNWDPRIKDGGLIYNTAISIPLSRVSDFIRDVQRLNKLQPAALCSLDLSSFVFMRYVRGSSAYLGKKKDSVDFDLVYYRSRDPTVPRLGEGVLEEIEQMALFKYGGLPHWGKNRNLVFDGVITKYPKVGEFLRVKRAFDPQGLFSSEWSDQVLGIAGRASIIRDGCALDGLCICSEDAHCAPDKGYFCRRGLIYREARICTKHSRH